MSLGILYKAALTNIFDQKACVFDYGQADDFKALWGNSDDGNPEIMNQFHERANRIVLVWDGRTEGATEGEAELRARRLAPHLTPLDWALAFSIKLMRDQAEKTENTEKSTAPTSLGIHIIDLTGETHQDSWAMRMRYQLLAEMPWVTLHGPLIPKTPGSYRKGYQEIIFEGMGNTDGLLRKQDDGLLRKKDDGTWEFVREVVSMATSTKESLADLARQWSATLVQSGDHHDLNNLIGPSIILGKRPAKEDRYLCSLYSRLEWQGLLPEKGMGEVPNSLGDDSGTDILAIDDKLGEGWHKVLCHLLGLDISEPPNFNGTDPIGLKNNLRLFGQADMGGISKPVGPAQNAATHDSNPIFERLRDTAAYTTRVLSNPFPGDSEKPWLMVLDLHLFEQGKSQEREWFKELLVLAGAIPTDNTLAWPGFSEDELREIKDWLDRNGSAAEDAYSHALSLFPRLCALRWPTVPMIIFSASGRRNLFAKLTSYGNITLASQKPNVLGPHVATQMEAFKHGWQLALESALPWLKVQRRIVRLMKHPSAPQCGQADSDQQDQNPHTHLTIALDESGDFRTSEYSAIGGVIVEATGTNDLDATQKTITIFETLREKGVNFFDFAPAYTFHDIPKTGALINSKPLNKKVNISKQVSNAKNTTPYTISTFRCLIPMKQYHVDKPIKDILSDGPYLKWLNNSLEILIAEYLPSNGHKSFDNLSLSIWLPSRSIPLNNCENNAQGLRFDFDFFGGYITTLGGGSVGYTLLSTALSDRGCLTKVLGSIKSLKVRKIPYYDNRKTDTPRNRRYESPLHWWCQSCKEYGSRGSSKLPRLDFINQKPLEFVEKKHGMCTNHNGDFLAADYSVVQHLADASLSMDPAIFPNADLGASNICTTKSFDVMAGQRLEDFLRAGRMFDSNDSPRAFKLAYQHDFFMGGLNRPTTECAKAPIEGFLLQRLQEYTKRAPGDVLHELCRLKDLPPDLDDTGAPQTLPTDTGDPGATGTTPEAPSPGRQDDQERQAAGNAAIVCFTATLKLMVKKNMNFETGPCPDSILNQLRSLIPNNVIIENGEFRRSAENNLTLRVTVNLSEKGHGGCALDALMEYEDSDRFWRAAYLQ